MSKILVNVDGYISEIPEGALFLRFTSGSDCAGNVTAIDEDGNELERKFLALEASLPQDPWYKRLLWE